MNIYIIIVTYNGIHWISKCIKSIQESTVKSQIVIIDNKSSDNTVAYIKATYPQITLIGLEENLGFGKANNIGFEYTIKNNADYILLLNQDAFVEPDMIEKLIQISVLNPEYGILSPMQLNGEKNAFDFNFGLCVQKYWNYTTYQKTNFSCSIYPVKFVMAAIWLLPTNCIETVGGFDPIFQHYGEDCDYVNRVRFHKYNVGVCPLAIGYHDRDGRYLSNEKKIYLDCIRYLCTLKNINKTILTSVLTFILQSILQLAKYLIAFEFKMFIQTIGNIFKVARRIPSILVARRHSKQNGAYISQADSFAISD